jgi:flagellar biosynthesis/type III secretory pathway protein FliH
VVRLWEIEAETLLGLGEPALLALIGQTQLREPERELPRALAEIRGVADEEARGRLLSGLMSLVGSEEVLAMVEKLLDASEELLVDFPYLRRLRKQAREEGLVEGLLKGKEKGKEEGKEEGLAEGIIEGLREAILEVITLRFDPAASQYRRVSEQLESLTERKALQQLLAAVVQAEDMAAFVSQLQGVLEET